MLIGKVIGSVISTRKHENLIGNKFLVVQLVQGMAAQTDKLLAIDTVGAGIGDYVMVVTGSGARISVNVREMPIDAAIVGIIDDENNLSVFDK